MVNFRMAGARAQSPIDAPPFHQWLSPDSRPWTLFYRDGPNYLLRFPGFADFAVSHDGRAISGWPVHGVSDSTIRHLYLNQVLPLALSKHGSVVLHASASDLNGSGIAFVGASGRGKSTLAAHFATHGFPCLADDGVALELKADAYWMVPSHPSLRLWEDSHHALLGAEAAPAPALEYTTKARFLASREIPFCNEQRRLCRIYLLAEGADGLAGAIEFEPAKPAEALVELVKNSFVLDTEERESLAGHFEILTALLARPVCHWLRYPRAYSELERVRLAILAHASE
jgi:hypothetical protein